MFVQWYPHCRALFSSTRIWACTGGTRRLLCCLSLLIWDLEVWGASSTWEAASAVKTEPPPKQTIVFLLSFAKSCGVDWGLTTSLIFVPAVKHSLEKVLGGHDGADSVAHWKVKVIISGLKFLKWGFYSVCCWLNKLGSSCKYGSLKKED